VCRRATVALDPLPQAAASARRFLDEVCRRCDLDGLRDELLLGVSELVTNSVVHARTPIAVSVSVATGVVEVEVQDHDSHPPMPRVLRADLMADLDALGNSDDWFESTDPRHPSTWVGGSGSVMGGRGLHLLAAISDTWGVSMHQAGRQTAKQVWFTLAVPANWAYTSSCHCRSDDSFHTASGTGVRHLPGRWDRLAG
jgi:hypothetical protein